MKPYCPKNIFCTLIFVMPCVFQTQFNMTYPNQLNVQIATHLHLIQMNPVLMNNHHKTISHHHKTISHHQSKPLMLFSNTNQISPNLSSKDNSSVTQNDNSPFKQIIKTHQTHSMKILDRSRHSSQNQSPKERNVETHHDLRQQPRKDYRLFLPLSKL